jgi:hypothetical protein
MLLVLKYLAAQDNPSVETTIVFPSKKWYLWGSDLLKFFKWDKIENNFQQKFLQFFSFFLFQNSNTQQIVSQC